MKFDNTLMTCVRKDLEHQLIPMLLGEPGIGKSSWIQSLATLMHTQCFVLACNQLADKADLTGARLVPVTDDQGSTVSYKQVFYPHAVIHDAIEYAKANPRETPILFLDELNRTTPDVTSEALSIPTLRSIGSVALPSNLRVVIAGNDKGNVTALDEASVSRFVLYRVTPDVQTFLQLDAQLNPFVKAVLSAHPECIFCKASTVNTPSSDDDDDDDENTTDMSIDELLDDGDGMVQITTPRTISGVSKWLNGFTNQELMELLADVRVVNGVEVSTLQEVIEGHVGATPFATLLLGEIASGIMNVHNQVNVTTVGKPACYDELKACANLSDVQACVASMTDRDKSGCLLYALYERADNAVIIEALADKVTKLSADDMKMLMTLSATDTLDNDNVHTLLQTSSALASKLSIILEA